MNGQIKCKWTLHGYIISAYFDSEENFIGSAISSFKLFSLQNKIDFNLS